MDNLKYISQIVKDDIPFYITEDSDYENFVRFVELYYEWLSSPDNALDIVSELNNYSDIDKTIDVFTNHFKKEIADVFPTVARIFSGGEQTANASSSSSSAATESSQDKIFIDRHVGNGILSEFLLSHNPPKFFEDKNITPQTKNISIEVHPKDLYSGIPSTLFTDELVDSDYIKLYEQNDYVFQGDKIVFVLQSIVVDLDFQYQVIDSNDIVAGLNFVGLTSGSTGKLLSGSTAENLFFISTSPNSIESGEDIELLLENGLKYKFKVKLIDRTVAPPVDGSSIRVKYTISETNEDLESTPKAKKKEILYTNQNHFFKLLRDFYQSKGSKKSIEFIFRTFFNESIELYYPKENLLKLSDNNWMTSKSIRTIPNNNNQLTSDMKVIRIVGTSSGAIANVESYYNFSLNNYSVNEYFLGNIFGEFSSKETVEIYFDNGIVLSENLYDCIVGFDIKNSGTNYPNNFVINNYIQNTSGGIGFDAQISEISSGEISSVEILNGGINYIVGEEIQFINSAIDGGAKAKVSMVNSEDKDYNISWTQDTTSAAYPETYWFIGDPPDYAQINYQNSKEIEVYMENRDLKYDDVIFLADFDSVDPTTTEFIDRKNGIRVTRNGALRQNPSIGPKIGNYGLHTPSGTLAVSNELTGFMGGDDYTIDFWYYAEKGRSDEWKNSTVFSFHAPDQSASDETYFKFDHLSTERFRISAIGSDGVARSKTSSLPLVGNGWRHVAIYITKAAGTSVYLDGNLVHEFADLDVDIPTDHPFSFGDKFADDVNDMYISSFRITSGQRFDEYTTTQNEVKIFSWEIDPIQVKRRLSETNYHIDYSINTISYMDYNNSGDLVATPIPDWQTLNIKFSNRAQGPIKRVDMITGGFGYRSTPIPVVSPETLSYKSQGSSVSLKANTTNIGGITKINIRQNSDSPQNDGFGVGYSSAPTLDLSTLGDGNAEIDVLVGPLCVREGAFLDDSSFVSSNNRIHDGYLWQDYSYVVRVNRVVDEWRDLIKKIVHPAGMMVFGEMSIETKSAGTKVRAALLTVLYEIVKNVNFKVKNMDGLGRWTYPEDPVNTMDLLSTGKLIRYNNRQETMNELIGISDDTPVGASADSGAGRYVILDENNTIPSLYSEVTYFGINHKDQFGESHRNYYETGLVGDIFTLYNISDEDKTHNEHSTTRSFGKYRVLSAVSNDYYIVIKVGYITGKGDFDLTLSPNDEVEFRWDSVSRGNVERNDNYWVGSTADGSDYRDDKFILHIISRLHEVPSLGTSYRSLERFKFYFNNSYNYDELVRFSFSPLDESFTSPYLEYYGMGGKYNGTSLGESYLGGVNLDSRYNVWSLIPLYETAEKSDNLLYTTDWTDHNWPTTTIEQVEQMYDRNYHAVLDSRIIIKPKTLVVTDENRESDGLRRCGMTNSSIERLKFNKTPQLLDNDFERERINSFVDKNLFKVTNVAHESIMVTYNQGTAPQTLSELNELMQLID